jgi:hypothetical protein
MKFSIFLLEIAESGYLDFIWLALSEYKFGRCPYKRHEGETDVQFRERLRPYIEALQ